MATMPVINFFSYLLLFRICIDNNGKFENVHLKRSDKVLFFHFIFIGRIFLFYFVATDY